MLHPVADRTPPTIKARSNPRVNPSPPPLTLAPAAPLVAARHLHVERDLRDTALAAHLSAAAAGSVKAFEAFYDTMVGHAQALARRMVRPPDVADVLSDAFFQAWRDASHFDPTRGSAATWLLTIVHSRALDLLRRQRATREVDHTEEPADIAANTPGPEELLAEAQIGSRLHAALAGLSANERWVLGLAYYRDLSHSEICEATGLPLGTVKSAIRRAQAKLREQLTT